MSVLRARISPLLSFSKEMCLAAAAVIHLSINTITEQSSLRDSEEVGFEPTDPFRSTVFKTVALDHSTTPPSLYLLIGGDFKFWGHPVKTFPAHHNEKTSYTAIFLLTRYNFAYPRLRNSPFTRF